MKVNIRNRFIVFGVLMVAMFTLLFIQLTQLMLVKGEEYAAMSGAMSKRVISIPGARGSILDRNGLPLAYDEKSYNVQFYRDPNKNTETDRAYYTSVIIDTIKIIEKNGGKMIDTFAIKYNDKTGEYGFDFGITDEGRIAAREEKWRENMFVGTKRSTEEVYLYLRDKYQIPAEISYEEARKILSVWQEAQLNAWVAYEPVVIAYNVDIQTVAEIETHGAELTGMSIADSTVRIYPKNEVAAHAIGYLGRMPSDGDAAMKIIEEFVAKGYSVDDLVGVEGIEKSMESFLTGNSALRQGTQTVEIDNMAVVQNVLSSTEPTQGYNVMLTLDIPMQIAVEQSLAKNIPIIHKDQEDAFFNRVDDDGDGWGDSDKNRNGISDYIEEGLEFEKLELADSGAAVVIDVNSGDVLALASYPSFDLNLFTGGIDADIYEQMREDPAAPLFNKAIASRATPGSIFKMVTGLGALMEGVTDFDDRVSCLGQYVVNQTAVDAGKAKAQGPRCWTKNPSKHLDQDIVLGLEHSCNYYFCEMANRLGIDLLDKWTDKFGLTSSTGIELPGEAVGQVGNQKLLFDPSKPIDKQASALPKLVMQTGDNSVYNLLKGIAEDRNVTYDDALLMETAEEIVYLLGIEFKPDDSPQGILRDENGKTLGERVREILSDKLGIATTQSRNYSDSIASVMTELQWTLTQTVTTGMGQSITQVTPIAVARYVAAVANGGTVYQTHIVDKVVGQDGTILLDKQPEIFDTLDADPAYLRKLMEGMSAVVSGEDGTAIKYFQDFEYKDKIAGKTGTAEVSDVDLENNSWFVCFAPYSETDPSVKPEIAVVVFVPNGYKGGLSIAVARDILTYFFEKKAIVAEQTIPNPNSLVVQPSPSARAEGDPNVDDEDTVPGQE